MGCYLYSQENRLIDTADFGFYYNPYKYVPRTLSRVSFCGCELLSSRGAIWVAGKGR
jgi:hypothetical protein